MVNKDFTWNIINRKGRYSVKMFDSITKELISEKSVAVLAKSIGIDFDGNVGGRTKDKKAEEIVRAYHDQTRGINLSLPRVIEYVHQFWDFDGERVTLLNQKNPNSLAKSSCITNIRNFDNHLVPYFVDNPRIGEITSRYLNQVQDDLLKKGELSNGSIDKIMRSVTTALNDAYKHGLIDNGVRIDPLNTRGAEKGILTERQIASVVKELYIMAKEGNGYHLGANEGICLAALTALRLGEVRALKTNQIEIVDDMSIIHVTHTWNEYDHEKIPKGKKVRQVTVPTVVAQSLLRLAEQNPWENGRVFWTPSSPDTVRSATFFRDNLYQAMRRAGIPEDVRRDKNITFHSLRHGYISYMRYQISDANLRLAVGHKDKETTDVYTHQNVENLRELADTTSKTFSSVIKAEEEIGKKRRKEKKND